VEVAVLYGDLSIVRVPWDEKLTLRRDNVIAIAVLNSLDIKRRQSSIEHDYYQIIWTDEDCCLTGHDGDYGFSRFDNPQVVDWRFPFILPENSIEFEGITIDKEEYAKAKSIYSDPDGGMF